MRGEEERRRGRGNGGGGGGEKQLAKKRSKTEQTRIGKRQEGTRIILSDLQVVSSLLRPQTEEKGSR